jgi:uncharacterized membrane protein
VQFLTIRFSPNYYTVDSRDIEVVKYLEATPPSSVVLHPPNLDRPSLASNLAGRPTVLSIFQSYVVQLVSLKEADNRWKDVKQFFSSNKSINRAAILRKYKVDYVYAPLKYANILDETGILFTVLKNSKYVVYKVKQNGL